MEFATCFATLLAAEPIQEPLVPLWAMELMASIFLYAWLFCVGACVGSFLNVVIYRLPRGKSLIHPGSICPYCGHPIRLYDNLPILSWLNLGGKCRDCRGPISSRYFLVELAVALIFLGVALVETKLTGTFPRRNWDVARWLISPLDTWPFWSAYGLHVVLLTTLLGAALIDKDRYRTPLSLFLPVVIAGFAIAVIGPAFFHSQTSRVPTSTWESSLGATLGGWLTGLLCGGVIGGSWSATAGRGWPRFAPVGILVAVGVVLGWREVLEVSAFTMLLLALSIVALRACRANVVVPLAGIALVAALPRLLNLDLRLNMPLRWPANYDGVAAAACLATMAISSVLASLLAPPQYFAGPPEAPQPTPPQPALPEPEPPTIASHDPHHED